MRVEKRSSRPTVSRSVDTGQAAHRRIVETPKESFEQLLSSEEHASLQSMLQEVMRLGDHLLERRTLQDLDYYKAAVRQFVHYAVNHAFRLRKGKGMSLKASVFVDTIDKALADLTEVVLTREIPRISILSRLEMIKGILIDCAR